MFQWWPHPNLQGAPILDRHKAAPPSLSNYTLTPASVIEALNTVGICLDISGTRSFEGHIGPQLKDSLPKCRRMTYNSYDIRKKPGLSDSHHTSCTSNMSRHCDHFDLEIAHLRSRHTTRLRADLRSFEPYATVDPVGFNCEILSIEVLKTSSSHKQKSITKKKLLKLEQTIVKS